MIRYITENWSGDLHSGKTITASKKSTFTDDILKNKLMEMTYKMKFGINKYVVGSIVSNEIPILLPFLSTYVTV